ncbi:MAG: proline dehydrogenase [Calditrichia bacterium]
MKWFNHTVANIIPMLPKNFVWIFSKKYIAGPTLQDAVVTTKSLMDEGCCATIDVLGEEVKVKEDSLKAVELYKQVLKTINDEGLDANISVKPTHMGLKIDKEFCYNNIRTLVELAKEYNNFVRVDMEDHTCTDDTFEIVYRLKKEFDNVGTVIQSYLRRTMHDLDHLTKEKVSLRLCKGIYNEPRAIAFKDMDIINKNYDYVLEKLLENGNYVGIATHDEKLVWNALRLIREMKLDKSKYEFQMLLGVQDELRKIIVAEGHKLRVYVPFGKDWFAYSTRRLKENPAMIQHIIKSILGLD